MRKLRLRRPLRHGMDLDYSQAVVTDGRIIKVEQLRTSEHIAEDRTRFAEQHRDGLAHGLTSMLVGVARPGQSRPELLTICGFDDGRPTTELFAVSHPRDSDHVYVAYAVLQDPCLSPEDEYAAVSEVFLQSAKCPDVAGVADEDEMQANIHKLLALPRPVIVMGIVLGIHRMYGEQYAEQVITTGRTWYETVLTEFRRPRGRNSLGVSE